ncbi:SH3 domain-containing protein [Agreia sp. COWG]|uniref:SH3 domain-containing protein n=1 Tax=Agreia sp. COWG TaxID=2773266 RepID=UPI001926BD1C|nr:SH3 domain-containing protein [Agreia sp. COWG]CAD6007814.1 SH3 domain-containing protein [Agreia sp. COWG]
MRITTAIVAHVIPERASLRLTIGDRVTVGESHPDRPTFTFVTAENGSGWVPVRYLSSTRPVAQVNTPYDTAELSTVVGDVIEIVREDRATGWLWCRSLDGRQGWIPASVVED